MKIDMLNVQKNFLCTCNHIVDKKIINKKLKMKLYYGKKDDESLIIIPLDKSKRIIKCFTGIVDITLVEILEIDNIPDDKYLIPELNYKSEFLNKNKKGFYLAGYPKEGGQGERCSSSGEIINIHEDFEFSFEHKLGTAGGSSGSPICLIGKDNYVIGIHRGKSKSSPNNIGTFIGIIIDKLEAELININYNNIEINDIEVYNSEAEVRRKKKKNLELLIFNYLNISLNLYLSSFNSEQLNIFNIFILTFIWKIPIFLFS